MGEKFHRSATAHAEKETPQWLNYFINSQRGGSQLRIQPRTGPVRAEAVPSVAGRQLARHARLS